MARVEKQCPEAKQESIEYLEIGCTPPGAIDNQELLIHEQTVGDDGFRAAGSQEFGDCDQIDGRGVPADPTWQSRVEKVAFMNRLAKCPYSGDN